jgi:GT2 family glycosyltransferase
MGEDEHSAAVASSRAALLAEIGEGHDLVFVRGLGNNGDELLWEGTRSLLERHIYREISVEELPTSSGDTALVSGGGGWCRPYHQWMARVLAIAELRFDRVILLPSSFDVTVDLVRDALMRTKATVFAREQTSFEAIAGLCRARSAHDCAFYFDYSSYRVEGTGTLNAFRTDQEATEGELQIPGNDDISLTCESLEAWLETIARHAVVRTDRAHVMIAAALMGKEVEFSPSSYHKVGGIAEYLLGSFPVREIPSPRMVAPAGSGNGYPSAPVYERLRRAEMRLPAGPTHGSPRITAVILSRDRPELVAAAVRSVRAAALPVAVLVIDNNSDRPTRRVLTALAAEDSRLAFRLSDRNLGCAGGRRLASELVETEFVLFLDDDAELMPGALESLLADLDAQPDAVAVGARVVAPEGTLHHFGGSMAISEGLATFTLDCAGLAFDDPSLPPTGPSSWIPAAASLVRLDALREHPIDERMASYADAEWCLRVEQARPGSLRRCRDALVLHDRQDRLHPPSHLAGRSETMDQLQAQAHFLHAHGRLLDADFLRLVPELGLLDGRVDAEAARLLLELIAARGTDWAMMAWLNGELAPVLGRARMGEELAQAKAEVRSRDAALATLSILQQRHETLVRIEAGGWWRLRSRLLPLLRLATALRDVASSRS